MRKRYFDLRPGESVSFGGSTVTAEAKTGQRIRLRVETAGDVVKLREGEADAPIQRPTVKPAVDATAIPRPIFKPR